jgi:Ca2+-transporting ATPase
MPETENTHTDLTTDNKKPWSCHADEVLETLHSDPQNGLTEKQVSARRRKFGYNKLKETKSHSVWQILLNQFKNLIVLLLGIASLLSFFFQQAVDGIAIGVVILINTAIGFFTELRAVRSMDALRRLGSVKTKVLRDGRIKEIDAGGVVPGDIVVLEGGDVITADMRIIEASKLQADESALTGESIPVSKSTEPLQSDTLLAERTDMLYKGTAVTRGSGKGVVIATGMDTELGRISELAEEAEEEVTPLEKRLNSLGYKLIWVTFAIVGAIAVMGVVSGRDLWLMIETSIALAVAAIPEGLPIVATIALARGMWRMAKRNALISKLSAVETLGTTDVVCVDKTGTITESRMTVTEIVLDQGLIEIAESAGDEGAEFIQNGGKINIGNNDILRRALEVGILCNNASIDEDNGEITGIGEPLEVALLIAGRRGGLEHKELISEMPEVFEEAFDPQEKKMATFNKKNSGYLVAVKGAPGAVLEVSSDVITENGLRRLEEEECRRWFDINNDMASRGLRVLALAYKEVESPDVEPYKNLVFLGMVGFEDPPRSNISEAIEKCQEANIWISMITGDQVVTAKSIGEDIGLITSDEDEVLHGRELKSYDELSQDEVKRLLSARIFARVTPEQKLDLITLYQKNNHVVAMTGDGVNDAPALKKADIGIAMGKRGTQVAQEASDMVLKDDNFSTIVACVEQGRVIFENIRKFVIYLISCNVSEVMSVALASVVNAPLPILPLQILFLNLVTDVFPALALGVGEGAPHIMKLPPRDQNEPLVTSKNWWEITGYAFMMTVVVLGALAIAIFVLDMDEPRAVTISFLTLAFSQLWHVFNMRESHSGVVINDITRNRYVWGALLLCSLLLVGAVYLPGISGVLHVENPGLYGWIVVLSMSLIPLLPGQIYLSIKGRNE